MAGIERVSAAIESFELFVGVGITHYDMRLGHTIGIKGVIGGA